MPSHTSAEQRKNLIRAASRPQSKKKKKREKGDKVPRTKAEELQALHEFILRRMMRRGDRRFMEKFGDPPSPRGI